MILYYILLEKIIIFIKKTFYIFVLYLNLYFFPQIDPFRIAFVTANINAGNLRLKILKNYILIL